MRRQRTERPESLLKRREGHRLILFAILATAAFLVVYRAYLSAQRPVPAAPVAKKTLPPVPVPDCGPIDAELFADVRDKTSSRSEENPAIFRLMCAARQKTSAGRRDVLLANLFATPGQYRGAWIHLEGVLTRLVQIEVDPTKNPLGLEKFYEGWIFTDQQAEIPVVVLFPELPEGLSAGDRLNETIALDAYFLKLLAYRARSGKGRAAPLLVGETLQWRPPDLTGSFWEAALLSGGFVALIAAASYLVFRSMRRDDETARELKRGTQDLLEPPASNTPHFLGEDDPPEANA